MKLSLQLPDSLADLYQAQATRLAAAGKPTTLEEVLLAHLEAFKQAASSDRVLIVDSRTRDKLEILLEGCLLDPQDLLRRVDRLASIHIGEVRVPFTISEMEELRYRASRQQRPIRDLVEEIVDAMHADYFNWPAPEPCRRCAARANAPVEIPPEAQEFLNPPPPPPPKPPADADADTGQVVAAVAVPAVPLDIASTRHVEHRPQPPRPKGGAMKGPQG